MYLPKEAIEEFQYQGYLKIDHQLIDNNHLETLRKQYDKVFAEQKNTDSQGLRNLANTEGLQPQKTIEMLQIMEMWSKNEQFYKLLFHQPLLDIAGSLIGENIQLFHDQSLYKPAHIGGEVPWHQDSGYFKEGAEKTIKPAAWIPFLDVNKNNGCLQVVRGGHRSGQVLDHKLEKEVGDKDSWYLYIDEKDIPTKDIVTCEMSIGSILFIHQLTPHRSLENYSEDVRWSIDLRFQNPNDETGFHERSSLVDPIILRKAEDPNYKPNWNTWLKEYEVEYDNARGRSDKDEFDSKNIEGAWMKRWKK